MKWLKFIPKHGWFEIPYEEYVNWYLLFTGDCGHEGYKIAEVVLTTE